MELNQTKNMAVFINGQRLAGVISVVSDFKRERVIGSDGQLEKPPTDMYFTIRRERCLSGPLSDGVNLRALDNFRVDIQTPFHLSTYAGCQWTAFCEELGPDNKIYETMTAASLQYNMS